MNLLKVNLLLLCSFLYGKNTAYCQSNEFQTAKFINYNFQNKLRFEWPINFQEFSKKDYYQSILNTNNFTKIILNNIEEIKYETRLGDPVDIQIFGFGQRTQMDIKKNLRPVSYQYKDTSLMFTGLHVIHLRTANKEDIRIYFDNVDDLIELKNISFDKVHEGIILDLNKRKIVSKKEMMSSSEILYKQEGDEMINIGILKENANYQYGVSAVLGGAITPGDIGLFGLTDFSRIKYTLNQKGISNVRSKISLNLAYAFLGSNNLSYAGASFLSNPVNPRFRESIKLMGFGLGIVNASDNFDKNITGAYFSFILERDHVYLNQSFNIPFSKSSNDWPYMTLMMGYRF